MKNESNMTKEEVKATYAIFKRRMEENGYQSPKDFEIGEHPLGKYLSVSAELAEIGAGVWELSRDEYADSVDKDCEEMVIEGVAKLMKVTYDGETFLHTIDQRWFLVEGDDLILVEAEDCIEELDNQFVTATMNHLRGMAPDDLSTLTSRLFKR